MRFIRRIVGLTVSCVMIAPVSLRAGPIIDFEDFPAGTGLVTIISSGGFSFVASDDVFLIVGDGSGASENQTQTLFYLGDGLITMFRDDGGVFDLLGVDLGEGNSDRPSSLIFITGMFSAGGSISVIPLLDGILPQFETVTLPGFTNLTSVTFDGDSSIGFSLDNIVVPEPETLVLLGLLALVAIARPLRKWAKTVSVFVIVVLLSSAGTSEVRAQWTGGPVLIGGDDTDHHFTSLGDSYIREGFNFLGGHVTNGNTLVVCIGCNVGQAKDSFEAAFDASDLSPMQGGTWTTAILTVDVDIQAFFNDTGAVKIQDAGIIYLPSSTTQVVGGQVDGGITDAQLNVVNVKRFVLEDFVRDPATGGAWGGLFTHTLFPLVGAYTWLKTLVPEVLPVGPITVGNGEVILECDATVTFFGTLPCTEIAQIRGAIPWHTSFAIDPGATDFGGLVPVARGIAPPGDVVILAAPALPDSCLDCNDNGRRDDCDIERCTEESPDYPGCADCNQNMVPDECDISEGSSEDCTGNGIPDECEPDCNLNGIADSCDINNGTSGDCFQFESECCVAQPVGTQGCGDPAIEDCVCLLGPPYDFFCCPPAHWTELCAAGAASCGATCIAMPDGVPDECQASGHCQGEGEPGDGIPDACDISCGVPDGPCYVAGRGQSRAQGRPVVCRPRKRRLPAASWLTLPRRRSRCLTPPGRCGPHLKRQQDGNLAQRPRPA